MRVTHRMIYSNFIGNMQLSMQKLMDLNIQASTQKRVNRPSDDPAGTARILDHRDVIRNIERWSENVDTAKGWLKQQDDAILQMSAVLSRIKEKAEQGSTGTYSDDQRREIAPEVRQLLSQLVNLANTEFADQSIFAGHKVDGNAYEEVLWLRDNHGELAGTNFQVTGPAKSTTLIQFTDPGSNVLAAGANYRYSEDGGKTFQNGTVAAVGAELVLNVGGATVRFDAATPPTVTGNSATDTNDTTGTWLWAYPTAEYMGDDNDSPVIVDEFDNDPNLSATAAGHFGTRSMVRIDDYDGVDITYSYTTDGGSTWVGNNTTAAAPGDTQATLVIPGGTFTLSTATDFNTDLLGGPFGQQYAIRPRTADINFEIAPNQTVTVNGVGKDVFGGLYTDPTGTRVMAFGENSGKNMFEIVGRLVSAMETGQQSGCQVALEDLNEAMEMVMVQASRVGGLENRLDVAESVLSNLDYNEKERLSKVEDVDLSELMTSLSQQQVAYEAVLKSSSTIMRMSLVNYV